MKIEKIRIQYNNNLVLQNCDFEGIPGNIVGIVGSSGSGKSSLLSLLSLSRYERDCDYFVNNRNLRYESLNHIQQLMRFEISYLQQNADFMNHMTVLDNLILEAKIVGKELSEKDAKQILEKLGIVNCAEKYPSQLSGGQKQKLSIGTVLVKDPTIIICDEITSSLDKNNTQEIIDLLKQLAHEENKTVILSTHEKKVVESCDIVYEIKDKTLNKVTDNKQVIKEKANIVIPSVNNYSTYLTIILSRIKRKKASFIFSTLISAVIILVSSLTITNSIRISDYYKYLLEKTVNNELFVYNHSDPAPYTVGGYLEDQQPFLADIYQNLQNIEGVDMVYPLFGYPLLYPHKSTGENDVIVKNGDKVISTHSINDTTMISYEYCFYERIFPYFDEQISEDDLDEKISGEGIIISRDFADFLEINNLSQPVSLSLDVYVTSSAFDFNTQIGFIDEFGDDKIQNYTASYADYEKVRMTLPIVGILSKDYVDNILNKKALIYVPKDLFFDNYDNVSSNHELINNGYGMQYPFSPKSFRVYIDPLSNREAIKDQIKGLSDTIVVDDVYMDYEASIEAQKSYESYNIVLVLGLLIIVVGMMWVFGNYHKNDVLQDYVYLKLRGFSNKNEKMMALIELVIVLLVLMFISMILSNIAIAWVLPKYMFSNMSYYMMVIMINAILSIMLLMVRQLPLLLRKD